MSSWIPSERYRGINFPSNPSDEDIQRIGKVFNCDLFNKINLTKRIGSDSERGKVFDAAIADVPVAIKIFEDLRKFEHEVQINEIVAASSVHYYDYFLGYIISGRYQVSGNRSLGLLVMERAFGDLKQILQNSTVSQNFLEETFASVVSSLFELSEIGIFHGNLHCGNVFIVLRKGHMTAVLGDWGESAYMNNSPNNAEADFHKFISTFLILIERTNHPIFRRKLSLILDFYGKVARQIEGKFDDYLRQGLSREAASKTCNIEFLEEIWNQWLDL